MSPLDARRRLATIAIAGAARPVARRLRRDDDDDAATRRPHRGHRGGGRRDAARPTHERSREHQTVAVDGIDYGFENLPAEVPAGTMLSFTNTSDAEFHEMVVIRLPDEETRSVEELVQLPPEES